MKRCNKCQIEKEVTNFYLRSNNRYENTCKSCRYERLKEVRNNEEYREKHNRQAREYRKRNKLFVTESKRRYYDNNKEKIKSYSKKYFNIEENRKRKIAGNLRRKRERIKSDDLYYFLNMVRELIRNSFKRRDFKKNSKTAEILGCSFVEFKIYLESKFESWMTWENKGLYNGELNYGWDIDHIIPISSATNIDELIKLNHYTNLQPLCSKINRDIKKNNLLWEKM